MGFLHSGSGLPLAVQSRRGIVLTTVISLALLIALWNTFSVDAPYHLRGHPHPHEHHPPPPPATHDDDKQPPPQNPSSDAAGEADPLCANHPDLSNVAVVMKTGATESFARLPTQFLTTLRCVDDFLVFSDMEQNVAGFPVHDALENVLEEAKEGNDDFDLYRDQQACIADVSACTSGRDKAKAGWSLDKYKNIHMAEKAWAMMPGKDWYLFVDADTYVLWNSLATWLAQLDPSKELYVGSVAVAGGFPFSHGGSGYVLSHAAMDAVVGKHPGVANKYDVGMKKECCGDLVFSKAAKDVANISVTNVWPTINGEHPFTLPFGPSHWCHPIVTMHHISVEVVSSFWEWENEHYASSGGDRGPILMKDIFDAYFRPRLQARREDWDNLADESYLLDFSAEGADYDDRTLNRAVKEEDKQGVQKDAHLSFEHCRRACEEAKKCFQFRFKDGVCGIGYSMKLGKPVPGDGMMSGWNMDKIDRWTGKRQTCDEVLWPEVHKE